MDTINTQLDALFEEWISAYRGRFSSDSAFDPRRFVKDGIIDERYWPEGARILFLLKDHNREPKPEYDWDMRKEGRAKPWKALGSWAYALQVAAKKNSIAPFAEARATDTLTRAYLSCAVMNLKKVAGGGSAPDKLIHKFAARDADRLQQQIRLIVPDVIVCCGTFDFVQDVFGRKPRSDPAHERVMRDFDRVWIQIRHPSNDHHPEQTYNTLAAAYLAWLQDQT
jgi:hypothetical protein